MVLWEKNSLLTTFNNTVECTFLFGGLAQLGERYNGIVEVRGSNPLSSINPKRKPLYTSQYMCKGVF